MPDRTLVNVEFVCPRCGIHHFIYKMPKDLLERVIHRHKNEERIQDILPDYSLVDRDRFITGYCENCQLETDSKELPL